jgi:hypothetical protein
MSVTPIGGSQRWFGGINGGYCCQVRFPAAMLTRRARRECPEGERGEVAARVAT